MDIRHSIDQIFVRYQDSCYHKASCMCVCVCVCVCVYMYACVCWPVSCVCLTILFYRIFDSNERWVRASMYTHTNSHKYYAIFPKIWKRPSPRRDQQVDPTEATFSSRDRSPLWPCCRAAAVRERLCYWLVRLAPPLEQTPPGTV